MSCVSVCVCVVLMLCVCESPFLKGADALTYQFINQSFEWLHRFKQKYIFSFSLRKIPQSISTSNNSF